MNFGLLETTPNPQQMSSVLTDSSRLGGLCLAGSSTMGSVVVPLARESVSSKQGERNHHHRHHHCHRDDEKKALDYSPLLRKSLSELPSPSSSPPKNNNLTSPTGNKRRSIFGKELGNKNRNQRGCNDPTTTTSPPTSPPPTPIIRQKRASSVSTTMPRTFPEINKSLLNMLSRPLSETRLEERPHFCDLSQVPETVLDRLPQHVPTPLQRFYDGTSTKNGGACRCKHLEGMYPLVRPCPILRQRGTSLDGAMGGGDLDLATADDDIPAVPPPSALNLTRSLRYHMGPLANNARKMASLSSSGDDTSTASSSHSGGGGGRKVIRFDPRVTVTEFEDDPEHRQWFSDFELERFKKETIALAQKYLVQHPSILEDYCKPYLDPVTGTFRKKALFSILVLKATRSDDSLDELESENSSKRYDEMRQELANATYERILLVNHNKLVLDLFERSLVKLFPKAAFMRCDNNEEALQVVGKATDGTFDLILAEDRLYRPWKSCEGLENAAQQEKGNILPDNSNVSKSSSMTGLTKKSTKGGGAPSSLLVSDLFRMTRGFERTEKRNPAMLIAVSTHPEVTRPNLHESGADAVWGLPPPLMSDDLRDELVARLIQKRRKSNNQQD